MHVRTQSACALVFAAWAMVGACQVFLDVERDAASLSDGGTSQADGGDALLATDAADCKADFLGDRKNCGRCGRDCLGGSCNAGVCEPFVLSKDLPKPWYLAGDDNYLYVSSNEEAEPRTGDVFRVDKRTGVKLVIARDEYTQFGIVLFKENVLWSFHFNDGWRGTLRDRSTNAGVTFPNTLPPHKLNEFLADGDTLWSTSWISSLVFRWSAANGVEMSAPVPQAEGICGDEAFVYIASNAYDDGGVPRGGLFRALHGGAPTLFASMTVSPRRLANGRDHVYFATQLEFFGRVSKTSKAVETLALGDPIGSGGIAVDDDFVYVANSRTGTFYRSAIGASLGAAVPLSSGHGLLADVHADARAVYFTDWTKGELWAVVK